jgi:hypothetical protein
VLNGALKFLHSIGEIVQFSEERICIKPASISQTLAKFVSPDEHKLSNTTISKVAGNGALLNF